MFLVDGVWPCDTGSMSATDSFKPILELLAIDFVVLCLVVKLRFNVFIR